VWERVPRIAIVIGEQPKDLLFFPPIKLSTGFARRACWVRGDRNTRKRYENRTIAVTVVGDDETLDEFLAQSTGSNGMVPEIETS
jgi:hypothetical protein